MKLQPLQPLIAAHLSAAAQPRTLRLARLIIAWLAVCLFGVAAFALDPQKSVTQFAHTAWTEKDGAPADIVAITQTQDGSLWLGTWTGLFSFDGVRFSRFEPQAGEHLPAQTIRRLLATRDGSLWIVFYSGSVSRLLHGHLTSYSEREGLPAVFALAECQDGSLIAGTAKGLLRFKNGVWTNVTKVLNFPGQQARLVYVDRENTLWVVTEDRIVYLPSEQKQFVDPRDPVEATGQAGNFAEAPDGEIWISGPSRSAHTVRSFRGGVTEIRVDASGLLFDRNGSLWVGLDDNGLRRIASQDRIRGHRIAKFSPEAEPFTAKDGLSGDVVYTLFEDREGNIWSATTHGLDRFRENTFTPVSIPYADMAMGIMGTSEGSLWTFGNKGILRVSPHGDHEAVTRSAVNSMSEDEGGVLWIVSDRTNVYRFQQGRLVDVISPQHPLPGAVVLKNISSIAHDREGGIWLFDADQGLFRIANGALTKIANQSETVYPWGVLYVDRNDRIWLGQFSRVALYDHGKSQVFGKGDGVPPGAVCTIYHDRAGNVWAAGHGGLSKFGNDRFHSLSKSNGLPAQSVFGIVEDGEGYWWLATEVGVLRIPAGELDRAVANPAYRIRYESFNMLDGLPGTPQNTFPGPMAARTMDGRIWFATKDGIAYVDPQHIPKNDLPPPVHVETIRVNDKVVAQAGGIALNHDAKNIEIDYTAFSLSIPERVRFRYKLQGFDTDWQEPGTRRQAFYNGLRPGKYQFRVIACNDNGVWNEVGATLGFVVAPAWYQTIWFSASCLLGLVLLLWALYQLRLRQLRQQFNMMLEARLGERTRIARDLHDTLLQSFHGLMFRFQAARNMLPGRPEQAMQALDGAIARTEQAITESRDAIGDLRSELLASTDLAELLTAMGQDLAAAEDANGNRPLFRVIVEGERRCLSPILQDEVYWIARELLRNAFQHAHAHRIEAEIRYEDHLFRMRIRDDGKGMDPAVLEAGGRAGHWGLTGLRERAQKLGVRLDFWSEVGAGTEVQLTVAAAIAYEQSRDRIRFRLFRKARAHEHQS
jgi:signal transduction histidine kinase/ligand-binding sensor domain-containing protein